MGTRKSRIIKPNNVLVSEFGNRSQIWEIGDDQVKGFGTGLLPGSKVESEVIVEVSDPGTSWGTWDETTEAGWGDDANTFICLFNDATPNANEIGLGAGLSEANRTLTMGGAVPGATGSPPRRVLDTNDYFDMTPAGALTFLGNATWTIIWKFNGLDVSTTRRGLCNFYDNGAPDEQMYFYFPENNDRAEAFIWEAASIQWNHIQTVNDVPSSGDVYAYFTNDGTDLTFGFSQTKQTTWAGVAANDKISVTYTPSFTTFSKDCTPVGNNSPEGIDGSIYYIIMSKSLLLT